MKYCSKCHANLQANDRRCSACGTVNSFVSDCAPSENELKEAYGTWLERGKKSLKNEALEEAVQALREAVRRSRTLTQTEQREIESRLLLAQALEKLNKTLEAADQYRIIAQETSCPEMREVWLKRSQDLMASGSHLTFDVLFKKEHFRSPADEEFRYVPLYCFGCKRLLSEAEVYNFRRALANTVPCWCGSEAGPLVKDTTNAGFHKEKALNTSGQRQMAIEVADSVLPKGKHRTTAFIMAILFGWCGGHKFYLGETTAGWIYLFWFWTLVPFFLSLYEALILIQMTLVSFNMTYNLDLVLAQIILDEQIFTGRSDEFSQESEKDKTTKEAI